MKRLLCCIAWIVGAVVLIIAAIGLEQGIIDEAFFSISQGWIFIVEGSLIRRGFTGEDSK